ncbi:MAG: cytochrome C [Candidatus Zixiibacteriota bacterium]|nr:MAG: cytochrome C [candidate division Zixibacteria bacterium]
MPPDFRKIVFGLVIFLILVTLPLWTNLLRGTAPLEDPEISTRDVPGKDRCVREAEYMKANHMDLLNEWRETVVRDGERGFVTVDGRHFDRSLDRTCMDCHNKQEVFCDRCHNALAVSPYCWDCHIGARETKDGSTALR